MKTSSGNKIISIKTIYFIFELLICHNSTWKLKARERAPVWHSEVRLLFIEAAWGQRQHASQQLVCAPTHMALCNKHNAIHCHIQHNYLLLDVTNGAHAIPTYTLSSGLKRKIKEMWLLMVSYYIILLSPLLMPCFFLYNKLELL